MTPCKSFLSISLFLSVARSHWAREVKNLLVFPIKCDDFFLQNISYLILEHFQTAQHLIQTFVNWVSNWLLPEIDFCFYLMTNSCAVLLSMSQNIGDKIKESQIYLTFLTYKFTVQLKSIKLPIKSKACLLVSNLEKIVWGVSSKDSDCFVHKGLGKQRSGKKWIMRLPTGWSVINQYK